MTIVTIGAAIKFKVTKTMGKIVLLAWSRFRFVGESERQMREKGKPRPEREMLRGQNVKEEVTPIFFFPDFHFLSLSLFPTDTNILR